MSRVGAARTPLNTADFPSRRQTLSNKQGPVGATENHFTSEQYGSPFSFLSGRNAWSAGIVARTL
jgi:hypothetical protein